MRALVTFLATMIASLSTAAAQSPNDPARLFPHEAPITIAGSPGELHRMPLTAEVLERARPDLADVRVHDEGGQEVAFLVDAGSRAWPRDAALGWGAVTPLAVERRIEEGESLAPIWREVLRVPPPGTGPEGARWILELTSPRASFVRTVVVRFVDGENVIELVRGSVYRFDDPVRERLTLPLPTLPAALTPAPVIEIEIFGEGGYLEPAVHFQATREPLSAPTLTLPLVEISESRGGPREASRERRGGSTWIELERPVGIAPDRLRIITSTGNFHRLMRVLDVAQGEPPREIGSASVFRVSELEGAELLEIDLGAARGETLRVEIVDGDSPPLAELTLEAVVRQPVLVFAPPDGAVTLRFGGGRARAPRYDLRYFAGTTMGEAMAASRPLATLGAMRPNPRFDAGPALRFAMRAGRPVELASYTHLAAVTVSDAPEGLTELRLPPAALAFARFDLADVRVVDAEGRQWPYLWAQEQTHELVAAGVSAPDVDDPRSTFTITPPVERARIDRVLVHTPEPYLSRSYVLRGIDDDGRRVELAQGYFSRQPADEATPLEIRLAPTRASRLELEVEDGSDAPIALERVELGIVSPSLYLAAPDGDYRLAVGDADASRPEYEIERARALVLAVRAGRGEVGEPSTNPAHVEPLWYESADLSTWLVWALLILAVLVLGIVTLRLARSEPSDPPPPTPPDVPGAPPEGGEPPASGGGGEGTEPVAF